MKAKSKRLGSTLLIGVLVSLLVLAGSLSSMQLRPGHSSLINRIENSENREIHSYLSPILSSSTFMQGVLGLAFILIIFLFLSRLILRMNISQLSIRENLGYSATLALVLGVIYLISRIGSPQAAFGPGETRFELPPTLTNSQPYPIGEVPPGLIWLVAGILLGGLGLLLVFGLLRRGSFTEERHQILQETERAVHDLRTGKDLEDVIVQYYAQMAKTLREQRGIERNHTMTVREFEHWLEGEGVPSAPVHQLTSLFEVARYSERHLGYEEHLIALQCLDAIISHCRGGQ